MTRRGERGAVMVETLIAFVPVFTLFLGIVQYVLLAAAQLVVHHAAVAGVRSASVVLDDDPAHYMGAERLSIVDGSSEDASVSLNGLASVLLSDVPSDSGSGPPEPVEYGARMAPIRNAIYAKLAAIVPPRAQQTLEGRPGVSVLDRLGTAPARRVVQARHYLPVTTTITFPRSPGATELFEDRVEPTRLLTVRVRHLTTCTVPLVSAIMCPTLSSVQSSTPALENLRVKVLEAEASMPLQSASYAYASERAEPKP